MKHGGVVAALVLLCASGPTLAKTHPFSVRLDVRWGEEGGAESVREAVERAALESAATAACVGSVSDAPETEADLVWRVVLEELEEETIYDDSVYGVQTPGEPGKDLRRTARIRLDLVSQVSRVDGGASDRARRIRIDESRRPRMVGEDTAEALRAEAVRRLREELGRSLCRGVDRIARTSR